MNTLIKFACLILAELMVILALYIALQFAIFDNTLPHGGERFTVAVFTAIVLGAISMLLPSRR